MAPKRASVPGTAFGRAPGALDKLTGRTPIDDAALVQDSETLTAESRNTVSPSRIVDEKVNSEKFTIYISPDQMDKLDELALAYRKRTGKRINRNVIMRKLIDVCDLELLLQSDAD